MSFNLNSNASASNQPLAGHMLTGTSAMRIGIDFDNTIAGYDDVFIDLAKNEGFIPNNFSGNRQQLREIIRSLKNGEKAWMSLQGQAYGKYMQQAKLLDGVDNFLRHCQHSDVEVFIVSHKTEYGHYDPERVNLRRCAMEWIGKKGLFDKEAYDLPRNRVFFESTREAKVQRINALCCTHFIDDLDLIFTHPGFPGTTRGILLDRYQQAPDSEIYQTFYSWNEITDAIFGR